MKVRYLTRENIDDIQGRIIIVPAMNYPAFQSIE